MDTPLCPSGDDHGALRDEMSELHARFCRGLGDPKRLLIIAALRDGEKSVGELTRYVGATHSNVSQHLGMLRDLGLVLARRVDNSVLYRLSDPRLAEVVELLRAIQADVYRRVPGSSTASPLTSPLPAHVTR